MHYGNMEWRTSILFPVKIMGWLEYYQGDFYMMDSICVNFFEFHPIVFAFSLKIMCWLKFYQGEF
jgi:hypothetical protein